MPAWIHQNRVEPRSTPELQVIQGRERKKKQRQEFLDHLARKHAARMDIPLHIARAHVDRVAVSACEVEPEDRYDDGV